MRPATRRPPTYPTRRRAPQNGARRVPTRKEQDEAQRALIREAATFLREDGHPEHADAVDSTLTLAHLALLKRAAWDERKEGTTNMPISMPETERAHFKAAIAAARQADPTAPKLEEIAAQACEKFLASDLVPRRTPRGLPGKKVNLNMQLDDELRARVIAHGKELAEELGWSPTPTQVIKTYLQQLFPLPEEDRPEQ